MSSKPKQVTPIPATKASRPKGPPAIVIFAALAVFFAISIPLIGYVLVNPTPLDVKILEYIAKGWNIPFLSVGFFYVWVWLTHKFSLVGQTNSPAGYNNGNPRPAHSLLTGMAGRLHSAHMNATEAFAPFAAAVILAHLRGVPALEFAKLCLLFLALRLAYQLFYAINLPTLRSFVWTAGFLIVVALFALASFPAGLEYDFQALVPLAKAYLNL